MAWVAGQKLRGGYYTVEKELGRGRFGITYLVHKDDGERRVVKTLNDDLLQSLTPEECDRLETRFWQEAVKLSKCSHSNIVKAEEPFKEQNQWCFAMEYVDGINLAERRLPLPESEALRYIQQIGEALEVVHENHLIHRDVKPENIVVRIKNEQPQAVLIDFGLAFDFSDSLRTARTRERAEGFAPLELYSQHSQKLGAYTDVYSLAATLYVLLTGTVPPSSITRALDNVKLVSPKEVNDRVSARTNQAILKGMELEIQNRPQTVQEWLGILGLSHTKYRPIPKPKRPLSLEDRIKIAGVVVAAIAALGGVGGFLSGLSSWFKPSLTPTPISSPTKTP